jgi:hypothetical protein
VCRFWTIPCIWLCLHQSSSNLLVCLLRQRNRAFEPISPNFDGLEVSPTTPSNRSPQHNPPTLSPASTMPLREITFRCGPVNVRTRMKHGSRCLDGRGKQHLKLALGRRRIHTHFVRLLGFGGCLIGAAVCFFVAFLTLPLIAIRYIVSRA